MSDLEELKRLAMAATPGKWFVSAEDCEQKRISTDTPIRNTKHSVFNDSVVGSSEWTSCSDADAAYIAAANPAVVLDLIERLERAGVELAGAQERCNMILDAKNAWADRAAKAEALTAEYQKIIGAECLRLQEGDVLVVRFDPKYVPVTTEEYYQLRQQIHSILPKGVHGFFLLADITLDVLTDEQLEQAGLMRKVKPEPACPSSLHDAESLQDGLDALMVRTRRNCDGGEG